MALVTDADGDNGPRAHAHPYVALYFVMFIVVGSFFVVGLFVGVVVDQYNKQHQRFTGSADLTAEQTHYLQCYKVPGFGDEI
jgi:hypothetical protein